MEGDVPREAGPFVFRRAEPDGAVFVAVLAEHEGEVLFLHHARLASEGHAAGEKERLRVGHAEGLEGLVVGEQLVVDFAEGEFGVEVEAGLELLGGKSDAGVGEEGGAEFGEARLLDGQAGGHFVTAVLFQKLAARPERGDEREAGDAASAAFAGAGFIEADDERGAVKFFLNPRGDDADDAGMPARCADDDGRVALGVEALRDLRLGLAEHVVLDAAALAVLRVEAGGDGAGAGGVGGEEQFERVLRGAEASGGIEARGEAEADVRRAEGRTQRADFDQLAQPDPARVRELGEAAFHERAVFLPQRDEVGHGAERDEIEMRAQIEVGERAPLEQGVGGFENEADAAEVVEIFAELRIH